MFNEETRIDGGRGRPSRDRSGAVYPTAHSGFFSLLDRTERWEVVAHLTQPTAGWLNHSAGTEMTKISSFGLSSIPAMIPRRFRSDSHSFPYRHRWRSTIGHVDGSVLNDDSDCPGRASRTLAVRSLSSSSQPVAVGRAAGRPG